METKEFYSPKQIYLGSFLGGPVAGAYYLCKNFIELGFITNRYIAILLGFVIVVACSALALVAPDSMSWVLPVVAYSAVLAGIAFQWQVTKEEVAAVENYSFKANWNVAKVGLIGFITYLVLIVTVVFIAVFLGFDVDA